MKKTISEILFEEIPAKKGKIGLITLNRPQVLNALNHVMFLALDENLAAWHMDDKIEAAIIRAVEGRAFCAGGDIRYAYERKMANDPTLPNFFHDEYRMNSRLYHFSKPYIALLDGITMGGGAGISLHGSFRIGTERLVFAMPETAIGFYPDVGTTYILSRLPSYMGIYLGLTGARISYADCFALGLVDEIISHEACDKIIPVLSEISLTDKTAITEALSPFVIKAPPSELFQHQAEIEACFSKKSVEEILTALENTATEWCQKTADILKTKSPTSLKVTLQALQRAATLSFDHCIQMEDRLTLQ